MLRTAALAALLLAWPFAARADGFFDSLPPPLEGEGCPSLEQLHLESAAQAVRAAWPGERAPLVRAEVQGVWLRDDPRAIEIVRTALGKAPPPGWKSAARCRDSVCALQAALGAEPGAAGESLESALWMLAIGARGPVASLDQSMWKDGQLSLWRAAELRTLAAALGDLPPALLSAASNLRAFYRVPDGETLGGGTNALSERSDARLGGGGTIRIRDTVWKMEPKARREVIAHELGHQIDYGEEKRAHSRYALSHGSEWLGIGGWLPVSPDRDATNGYRLEPHGESAWTEASWPSEEMPNSIAQYRYQARLLHDYSPSGFAYAGRYFGREYLRPEADPQLDALIDAAGGRLALFRTCAAMVTRTIERPEGGPAELFVVHANADGAIESAAWDRWSFVSHAPCVETALAALRKLPQWTQAACRRDPDELWVRLAERLEEVEAAVFEASRPVLAARGPEVLEGCLRQSDLRPGCLAGPRAAAVARAQVQKLAAEFAPGKPLDPLAREELERAVLVETPLFPADEDLFAAIAPVGDGQEMLAACLGGTISITSNAGKTDWRYWVPTPPKNQVRGFTDPIPTPACARDFGKLVLARHILLEPPLVEALVHSTRKKAEPLAQEFAARVLGGWEDLRRECGIAPASKATGEQRPCAASWIEARLGQLVPERTRRPLAEKIATQLKGP